MNAPSSLGGHGLNVSAHAKQRYAERVACKDQEDVKAWVAQNNEKIERDISELVNHGKCVYQGKKSDTRKPVDVIVNGTWIILTDAADGTVITIFKVTLGLDDAFDKEYVDKMVAKLNDKKAVYQQACEKVKQMNDDYQQICDDLESEIAEYKASVKNMEELVKSYKDIINSNTVMTAKAKRDMEQVVNDLVNKKVF